MHVNPKYIQILADAVIPLLGYFLWDWNLYFIVLFYLLDVIANEVLMHLKSAKIRKESNNLVVEPWVFLGSLSLFILISSVALIHFCMTLIIPGIDFWYEIKEFWNYKDMGIEQGYILLPLIVLVNYQRYKLEFLLPKIYLKATMKSNWRPHILALIILMVMVIFTCLLNYFMQLPELFYLISIIVLTGSFQFLRFHKKTANTK